MPRKTRSRVVRRLRISIRQAARRLDRNTPDWARWLTPWLTSLSAHGAVLLALALIVAADSTINRPRAITADLARLEPVDLTSVPSAGDDADGMEVTIPPLDPKPEDRSKPDGNPLDAKVSLEAGLGLIVAPTEDIVGKGAATGASVFSLARPSELAAPFLARQANSRAHLARREGGSTESEQAVARGLDWLARRQKPDGHWTLRMATEGKKESDDPTMESTVAATALALLPMLGAGNTHTEPGVYQKAVARGLDWLLSIQKKDGELFTEGTHTTRMYTHALATMVLCEAYGLTQDPKLREPAQRAIRFIAAAQNTQDGGWRYGPGEAGDTSVFGWQLFALRSAYLAGLEVPAETIKRCHSYLEGAAVDESRVSYSYTPKSEPSMVMTAEALLIRQYLGWPSDHPALRKGVALVVDDLFKHPKSRNIYYWYYATQLLHNLQGPEWARWNAHMRESLIATQTKGDGRDRGSWDPYRPSHDRWGYAGGRHFTTALSVLTLEVYYRFLPLYGPGGSGLGH